MPTRLVRDGSSSIVTLDAELLTDLRDDGRFFWLDIRAPDDGQVDLVGRVFGFHPIAIEDTQQFGQRPKLEQYDTYAVLIVYGALDDEGECLVEVHCFFAEEFLITIRDRKSETFSEARERLAARGNAIEHPIGLLYRVMDGLVDSFFPVLATVNDQIDALGDAILAQPKSEQLGKLLELKQRLIRLRRVIAPQRDLAASLAGGVTDLPGMTTETERYFRDLYDHLIRLCDALDSYRDLLTSTMDVYLSTVSNTLNGVTKQLAVIATIFLPITFITGFFGQNFGWMVDHVGGLAPFLGLGIGLQLLVFGLFVVVFRRRGWF